MWQAHSQAVERPQQIRHTAVTFILLSRHNFNAPPPKKKSGTGCNRNTLLFKWNHFFEQQNGLELCFLSLHEYSFLNNYGTNKVMKNIKLKLKWLCLEPCKQNIYIIQTWLISFTASMTKLKRFCFDLVEGSSCHNIFFKSCVKKSWSLPILTLLCGEAYWPHQLFSVSWDQKN